MRTCDECGSRMPPFFPRKRKGDKLVCDACKNREEVKTAAARSEVWEVGGIDFEVFPYYHKAGNDVYAMGGWVSCPECGTSISYESQKPMEAWMERHSSNNELFGCPALKTASHEALKKEAGLDEALDRIRQTTDHHILVEALEQNQRLRRVGVSSEYLPTLDAQDVALKERLRELGGTKQGVSDDLQRNLDWTTCFYCGERIHEIENPVPGLDVERRGDLLFRHSRSGAVQCADGQHVATPKGSRPVEGRMTPHQGHVHAEPSALAGVIAKLGTNLRKFAHDSGDGETIYHCPFCGAGQVVGRSDGTAQCQFCDTAFTVQVQPSMSAVPQTIDGTPHVHPEMPGQVPGETPEEEDPNEESTEMELEPSEVEDVKSTNPFTSSRYYLTKDGVALSEEAYLRHLAIHFADDRQEAIEAVRASRGS